MLIALLEDREGTVWAGGWAIPSWETLRDSERQRPVLRRGRQSRPEYVDSLYEDSGGNLWAGAQTGLWRWKPGPPKLYPMPDPAASIARSG